MRIPLPSDQCQGLDSTDRERRYDIDQDSPGVVNVDDPRDAAVFDRYFGHAPDIAVGLSDTRLPSAHCSNCGFHRIAFTDRPACPRCGHEEHP